MSCVQAFIRAIMCNWLVCMALWLATSASTLGSKFMGIWLPISAFAAIGLEHCVANMCGLGHGYHLNVVLSRFASFT